ncbi:MULTISPECIES: DUF1826 domain-containing protein [unclassified Pseudomonas]|jgi:hypothetical protein|uniref:DUF1826 domain-containing protein n=1 Tax=unclassified Pseudomonas TaxID=196821 RepID=UPI00081242BC|nr:MULTISPECIES: DUF1826 domain-containing protein [unclassified Pseudomonas]MCX9149424.1 DUF1826 domain-containing protein [Pseudomonas sp. TB1-B1]CRM41605.1 hypothetical protein [Pseudomonas sp. 31 E 6]CRM58806.1 hypothetical protein [Pseudomonas sp. 31 E 5]CRM94144.1 hypothetical protein [Pseudomonas sp. 22 E 5]
MLAPVFPLRPVVRQTRGDSPLALSDILEDGVNLALWQRQLPLHIAEFGALLVALNEPLADSMVIELISEDAAPNLQGLASSCRDLEGYEGFIADVAWLVSAFACLLGAKRIGVRLRLLDKAMCPRFHVDHVPVRLITTYAGIGSQWLREGVMDRRTLSQPDAEPSERIEQIQCGEVALLKGTKWHGNENHGLIHRSPALKADERRLILTLDWLA